MALFQNFTNGHFFSLYGLIAVILIVIPNFIFLRKAQKYKPDDIETAGIKVVRMEFWGRFFLNIALVLLGYPHFSDVWMYAAIAVAVIYFILWIKFAIQGNYYPDIYLKKFLGIPLPFDIFNCLYFIFVSIWLGNFLAIVFAADYSICRMINANKAYKDLSTRRYVD